MIAKRKKRQQPDDVAAYYDRRGVLDDLVEDAVPIGLTEQLRRSIIEGERRRKLENVSIRIDPAHLQAIRKMATMRAVPYQTLIRQWLAERIGRELGIE